MPTPIRRVPAPTVRPPAGVQSPRPVAADAQPEDTLTGLQHYTEAERLTERIGSGTLTPDEQDRDFRLAQLHIGLAQAAVALDTDTDEEDE